MILLWGIPGDRPMAAVRRALLDAREPVFFFDQRRMLDYSIEVSVGAGVTGRLIGPGGVLDLDDIEAVYVRPYEPLDAPAMAGVAPGSQPWRHVLGLHDALRSWVEVTEARVIHRLAAMGSNGSKPYQVRLLRGLGFAVPPTLVTTDPEAAREFVAEHQDVIYKSISGVRSIVARVDRDHLERLDDVVGCPTQFQAYVGGRDVRVHVVGDRVFACEVSSSAVDYRYPDDAEVELTPIDLPDEIDDRCRAAADGLGLVVAGVDLRRTPDDRWVCFEVNPSPAFTTFDLDGAIGRAVADVLAGGPS